MDPDFVHQPQAGLRIEGTLVHPVEAHLHRIEEGELRAVARNDASSAGEPDFVPVDDPGRQAFALFHVEDTIFVAFRRPARPEVEGLRVMRVSIDDLEVLSQLCHVTFLDSSDVGEPRSMSLAPSLLEANLMWAVQWAVPAAPSNAGSGAGPDYGWFELSVGGTPKAFGASDHRSAKRSTHQNPEQTPNCCHCPSV